jgi:hypothetical protein
LDHFKPLIPHFSWSEPLTPPKRKQSSALHIGPTQGFDLWRVKQGRKDSVAPLVSWNGCGYLTLMKVFSLLFCTALLVLYAAFIQLIDSASVCA